MYIFLKAQAALIVGSLADFLTTILLVEVFHCWYIAGNATGNIIGAIAQFILSRNWAFDAEKGNVSRQIIRFVLIWGGNILISAAGVYVLTHYLHLYYLISKLVISIVMGLTYTFLLSKYFVFVETLPDKIIQN
jgi:putative flippase GtrA